MKEYIRDIIKKYLPFIGKVHSWIHSSREKRRIEKYNYEYRTVISCLLDPDVLQEK